MNMEFTRKLTIPMEVKKMYPLSQDMARIWQERDEELKRILSGESGKLLLIIGPCSADNEQSVMEYMLRLRGLEERVRGSIFIVPRLYTNKPRTTGEGYKGMLHQPDPGCRPDMFKGIVAIRSLHMKVLRETGFTCADEMLYPENIKYLDDILGYVTVGARSVEDQQHRLTASGLEAPVGMKNPTGGDLSVMLNAVFAAQQRHTFIYRGWEAHSEGNPYAHAILRGYVDTHGRQLPNYHYEDLMRLHGMYLESGLRNPAVIVDANHANSGKDPFGQGRIVMEVLSNCRCSDSIRALVKGFMIESYLEDGAQEVGGGHYGRSITDPCLGWQKSERLIYDIAERI